MFFALSAIPISRESQKVGVPARVAAKGVDLLIVVTIGAVLPYLIGPLLGFLYSILADGIRWKRFKGQSVGKMLLGLKVINRLTEEPASFKDSVFRNAPIGVVTFFAIIPVWGWFIVALLMPFLFGIEIYLMGSIETGHRLGDVMGDTEVVRA